MHVVIAILYGTVCYLSGLLYCIIAAPEMLLMTVICGPLIISGIVALLITVDSILWALGAKKRAARRLEEARADMLAREERRAAIRNEQRRRAA